LSAIRFGDVDAQNRFWTISACFQVLLNFPQKLLHTCLFNLRDGHAILPGAATVSADFFPSLSQNVRPEYAVIEGMKPTVPAPLGRAV
jgi:hypothetical protein